MGFEVRTLEKDRNFHIVENLIICVVVVFALLGAQGYDRGDAANSRLASVCSLLRHGTWYIDRPEGEPPNPFEQRTIDKVVVKDRLISSKPPMLSFLMAGEAWLLERTVGWSLDNERDLNKILRFMTFTLVGLAYITSIVSFARTLRLLVFDPLTRTLLIFSVSYCTQLWGYSTIINNHVPGAAMVMVSIAFAMGIGTGKLKPRGWRFFVFGLCSGMVPTLDMPGTIFVVAAVSFLFSKYPAKTLLWATLGGAIPLGIHIGLMYDITGSLLPVQMSDNPYLYEASYWRCPRGVDALNEPKLVYLFHMTFGRCGLFSLFPITFAGIAGTLRALVTRRIAYRRMILTGFGCFAILTAYYVFKTNNYGGEAYGFRWYIVAAPVLLLMGAPILSTMRVRWKWLFIGIMIGISYYSGTQCVKSPWGASREWTCTLFLGPSYGPPPDAGR